MRDLGLACFAVLASVATTAEAGKPTIVALAPAADARRATPIGPAGEVYVPDGKGAWVRHQAGGTAVELVAAGLASGSVIATSKSGLPFRLKGSTWTAVPLGQRVKAQLGNGTRALAAAGRSVFAFDKAQPAKLADAPAPVTMVAASQAGVVIATSKGLHKLEGNAWKPVKKAPKKVRALVSDRWAITDKGALDLVSLQVIPWPARARIGDATSVGDTLYAIATHGKDTELLTIAGGKAAKARKAGKAGKTAKADKAGKADSDRVAREPIPGLGKAAIVGIVADREGRVVVAARDGTLAVRVGGTWTTSEVKVELDAPRPGPAPAVSEGG